MVVVVVVFCFFFFFKQKTAYEMRISDWSSDVCSSDLPAMPSAEKQLIRWSRPGSMLWRSLPMPTQSGLHHRAEPRNTPATSAAKIGRASCRERVCQYV